MRVWRILGTAGTALFTAAMLQPVGADAAERAIPSPPAGSTQAQTLGSVPATSVPDRALLDDYCVACHNQRLQTAGLLLDDADLSQIGAHAELWEKVVRKLRSRTMPPARRPRPDNPTYDAFVTSVEAALDHAAAAAPNPGRPVIHRLNRFEYTNAIRDLLALEFDGQSLLPADDSGYGFDNIADVLSVSPVLLERYMAAARKISRRAVGDPTIRPDVEQYKLSRLLLQEDRMSDALPFGTRGGLAVRHHFPVDGEYVIKVNLQISRCAGDYEDIRGLHEPNDIDLRLDGERVELFHVDRKVDVEPKRRSYSGGSHIEEVGPLQIRLPVKAGTRVVGAAIQKRYTAPEGVGPVRMPVGSSSFAQLCRTGLESGLIEMGIEGLEIAGPFNVAAPDDTLSRRRLFECRPTGPEDEEPCARTILAALARRAYRRAVAPAELETLLSFYRAGRREGHFDRGIQFALERVLVAPAFLFRMEQDEPTAAPGTAHRISDVELASRLSFFLWSSIPDDELLDLAIQGKLSDQTVLDQQVRRMLNDDRSAALVSNFFGQWLGVRSMRTVAPDPGEYPEFDDNLREAFQQETELFLESQVREDRSMLELLTANYTFVNERLARHYGIGKVYGSHFRRVTYPDDRRASLLGHGSILTVTSYANRTSPVLRGKWVLETLIGMPPPEPPPNVPALREKDEIGQPTSVRGRLEEHRKNPVCASCHATMDPLGFALENFSAIGRWRTLDANTPVDASGVLPDGTEFDGPAGFRSALLNYREEFLQTAIEKLLTYALGRGTEYYDMPTVRAIRREADRSDHRWSTVILGIVKSTPFQMRRSRS